MNVKTFNVNLKELQVIESQWSAIRKGLAFELLNAQDAVLMMMILLLFLQKQNLASAIYLFGLGTRLSGQGLKHMR